jgi:hypothetical protein
LIYSGVATIDNDEWNALHDKMRSYIFLNNIFISNHACARMFEIGVSAEDLITLITNGEILEEYLIMWLWQSAKNN